LRSAESPRTIWVDAICINQNDYKERSPQVQMMLDVYSKAEVVNIWLGPSEENTSLGMEVLRYLAQSNLSQPAPWATRPNAAVIGGLRTVLQRAWFSRIWIVQEAAVSKRSVMMCGEDSFQWSNDPVEVRKFIRRIKFAAISPQWKEAGLSEINLGMFLQILNLQMQQIERQQNQTLTKEPDILDIAFELRHRQATDPRDMLFAIMGLMEHKTGSILRPDYSMNVEQVFQKLLEAAVEV
jgi:hypothetical protein